MSSAPLPDAVVPSERLPDPRSAVEFPSVPGVGSGGSVPASSSLPSAAVPAPGSLLPAPSTLPLVADPVLATFAALEALEAVVGALLSTVTGPLGLLVAMAYSALVAVLLPLPSELVLAIPVGMGLAPPAALLLVVLVSSVGKAVGSLAVLRVCRGAAFPVLDRLPTRPPAPATAAPDGSATAGTAATASRRVGDRLAGLADRYGHVGLTAALAVPFAPDTALLYTFGVVETDRARFAAAAFVGTALRLSVVAGLAGAVLSMA